MLRAEVVGLGVDFPAYDLRRVGGCTIVCGHEVHALVGAGSTGGAGRLGRFVHLGGCGILG